MTFAASDQVYPLRAAAFTPGWPMGYLSTYGPRADPATALTWGLMGISIVVILVVTALVVAGILARRSRGSPTDEPPPARAGASGLGWLYVGLPITVVALVISLVWTVAVLAKINSPAGKPAVTIEVTGHQWWWEVRYLGDQPSQTFTTANEIHIPVGEPVLVRLASADVIHSFWAPALTGKTDTVPGRVNIAWLQASRPGVYRGQCTEYCGLEHAHMALYVIAESPAAFAAWRAHEAAPAAPPSTTSPTAGGEALFQARCGVCHTVRGGEAGGVLGPDLTHLMSRQTIASGTLPNTPETLAGWISDPQALKPGSMMPATNLSGPELNAVSAYVETLK